MFKMSGDIGFLMPPYSEVTKCKRSISRDDSHSAPVRDTNWVKEMYGNMT